MADVAPAPPVHRCGRGSVPECKWWYDDESKYYIKEWAKAYFDWWTDKRTGQTKRVLWSNKTVITDHPDVVREVWEWAYVEVDIRELAKLKPQ